MLLQLDVLKTLTNIMGACHNSVVLIGICLIHLTQAPNVKRLHNKKTGLVMLKEVEYHRLVFCSALHMLEFNVFCMPFESLGLCSVVKPFHFKSK